MERPTEQDIQRLEEILRKFTEFLATELSGVIPAFSLPELISNLYLRLRMHVPQHQAQDMMQQVFRITEDRIERGGLFLELADGEVFPYRTAEEYEGQEHLRDMLIEASHAQGVTDDDIKDLIDGLEDEGSVSG